MKNNKKYLRLPSYLLTPEPLGIRKKMKKNRNPVKMKPRYINKYNIIV